MKILLYTLTLFILTAYSVKGQTMDSTLQKLVENKLIEKKQIRDFEKILNRNETKSNSAYLRSLYQIEFKKLTGHYYSELGMQLKFADEKPKPSVQTKINEELHLYLSKLKNCGLVTVKQFNDQSKKIGNNDYVYILQLLPDLADQSAYEEWLSSDKLSKYGEKLLINNIISEKSFEKFKNDVNAGKITSHYQLVDYCKNAIFFDLAKYSNDASIYLEQIHQEVSKLLPELSFTNFKYKIEVDSTESFKDYTSYKVIVSLKANNKTYTQKSFISPNDIDKGGSFLGKIDDQEFYKIFNKILADNQSPLRLHEIQPTYQYGQAKKHQYFGIIALSKNQLQMFRNLDSYMQLSYEKFKNSLTSDQIDIAIKEYQKIGLFNHLSTSQIDKAKVRVSEQENDNLNSVLATFPDVVRMCDTELGNLKDPYAELIKEYKRISHNQFNATEISDNFDIQNKKAIVKFKVGNKSYNKTLKIEDDWIDTNFFDFIRSVVTDQQLEGQFYELYTGGQEVSIIYLTKDQYIYLKMKKLLVFADEEWLTDE